jgi:hypothetical protein
VDIRLAERGVLSDGQVWKIIARFVPATSKVFVIKLLAHSL